MQNELMRGSRGSRVLTRSHEMNDAFFILFPRVPGCVLFFNATKIPAFMHDIKLKVALFRPGEFKVLVTADKM